MIRYVYCTDLTLFIRTSHCILELGYALFFILSCHENTQNVNNQLHVTNLSHNTRDRDGRDRMVVGFTTTYAISPYHY